MTKTRNPFVKLSNYLRDSREEARKITWPTRKEVLRYSAIVIALTILIAALFSGLDALFAYLLRLLLV